MSSTSWVLLILGVIILAIGIDMFRGMQKGIEGEAKAANPTAADYLPAFKKGAVVPEIGDSGDDTKTDGEGLSDSAGNKHRLADLVKKDTLLTFACGCGACKAFQTFLGEALPKLGDKKPDVITITTQHKEGEKAWKRDTKLEQVILYEPSGGVTGKIYKGHPCPRAFLLDGQRHAKWWSDNMNVAKTPDVIGTTTARELGLPDIMPKTDATSPGMLPDPSKARFLSNAPHGPGDGHDHPAGTAPAQPSPAGPTQPAGATPPGTIPEAYRRQPPIN